MEGAGEVEGQELGEVDAEEVAELGPVVLGGGADHRLDQEQRRHHQEEPGAGALRRGERHVARAGGTRASPARARASRGSSSARTRRTAGRCRRAARSARRRSRGRRWRSGRCRPAPRAASCSCRSSCGPGRRAAAAHADQEKNAVSSCACSGSSIASGRRPNSVVGLREVLGVVALAARRTPRACGCGVGERVGLLVVAVRLEVGDRLLAGAVGAGAAVLVARRRAPRGGGSRPCSRARGRRRGRRSSRTPSARC